MNQPSPRLRRLILAPLAAAVVTLGAAAPADALISDQWNSLPGLNAAGGADWVREYANDKLNPFTFYAATEDDGVYISADDGLSWGPFNSGLPVHEHVRTVFFADGKVYAGTTDGLFASQGGGAWQPIAQGPEPDPTKHTKL